MSMYQNVDSMYLDTWSFEQIAQIRREQMTEQSKYIAINH